MAQHPKKAPKAACAPPGASHAEALMAVAMIGPLVEAFLISPKAKEWTATKLGKLAVGDPNKVFEMREGTTLRPATAQKFIDVIEDAVPGFTRKFVRGQLKGTKT